MGTRQANPSANILAAWRINHSGVRRCFAKLWHGIVAGGLAFGEAVLR
jgi:hypothetical protein